MMMVLIIITFRDKRGLLLNRGCAPYCSWRVVALSLTILILLLTSVIVYFGAVKYPQVGVKQV